MWGFSGKTRALMGLGVLLLLMVAAGSIYALASTIRRKDKALFEQAEDRILAAQLEEAYEHTFAAGRGYLLARDVGSLEEYQRAEGRIRSLLATLRARNGGALGHARLAEVERLAQAHHEAMLRTPIHGSSEEIGRFWLSEVMPLSRRTRAVMDRYAELRRTTFEEGRRASIRADRRAAWVLGGTVLSALLLSALGGTYLVRSAGRSFTAEQRRRGEAEHGHAFLAALLDQLPIGVIAAEAPSGRVIHVNRSGRQVLAHPTPIDAQSIDDWDRWGVAHRLDGTPYATRELPLARAIEGETVVNEEIRSRDRIFANTAAPVRDPAGRIIAAVVAFMDVTERKDGEKEREIFLGALGHDLRNPLSAISLGAQALLRRDDLAEAARRAVERIHAATGRMNRLIEQLLDFARSQRGVIPIEPRRCDLGQLARDAVSEVELGNPGCAIRVHDAGGAVGWWDPDRLAQVTQNLVWNAVEHGAKQAPIDVTVGPAEDGWYLEVANRGGPIPEDVKARMFEPFRGGGRGKGIGLGLYIVRALVKAHGGRVAVDSQEGTTRFRVELPTTPAR